MTETLNFNAHDLVEQNESIKLTHNSRGFGWEIRILSLDVDRLESINNEMMKRFKKEEDEKE